MKTYRLEINSPVSIEKYWLYCDDVDSDNLIYSIKTIHSTDSYAEIRMILDLYGLKVESIKIRRYDTFPDFPSTHKINCVFVNLNKNE